MVELLQDVDKIRSERRKSKANKNKFTGVGNDGMAFGGTGSRYGGFGSDSLGGGGYANDHYSSGSGSGRGGNSSSFNYNDHSSSAPQGRRQFEEYDAGGDDIAPSRGSTSTRSSSLREPTRKVPTPATAPPPPPAPVQNLLDFDDDAFGAPVAAPAPASNKALPAVAPVSLDGMRLFASRSNRTVTHNRSIDDDFADFQAAPVQAVPAPALAPAAPVKSNDLFAMLNSSAPLAPRPTSQPPVAAASPPFAQATAPPGYGAPLGGFATTHRPTPSSVQPTYASPLAPQQNLFGGAAPLRPTTASQSFGAGARPSSTPAVAAPAKPAANFDDLWSLGLGASTSKPATPVGGMKSMQALQQEKAQASIWGAAGQKRAPQPAQFGAFGVSSSGAGASGDDDLLL